MPADEDPTLQRRLRRIKRYKNSEQRQILSPIWESYVYALSQPAARLFLNAHEKGNLHGHNEAAIDLYRKDLHFHPFNMSSPELNAFRAQNIFAVLEVFQGWPDDGQRERSDWWPRDTAGLVQLIKKEREEMDTLGYIDVGASRNADGGEAPIATGAGEHATSSSKTVSPLKRKHTE